jgi:hypothetical protein
LDEKGQTRAFLVANSFWPLRPSKRSTQTNRAASLDGSRFREVAREQISIEIEGTQQRCREPFEAGMRRFALEVIPRVRQAQASFAPTPEPASDHARA